MSQVDPKFSPANYWQSLEELSPALDLPPATGGVPEAGQWLAGATSSRREFLKLLGASLGLAGLTGCRWPKEEILPFARRPQGRQPGVPVQYATAFDFAGNATGLLVTSIDGRPVKIEGNPQHPLSRGACDCFAQASLLELYDPERSKQPVRRQGGKRLPETWADFEAFARQHFSQFHANQGEGLFVLSEAISSPSLARLKRRLLALYPRAHWLEYEPVSRDSERNGTQLAFGRYYRPQFDLRKAKVIVTFDEDLLSGHPASLKLARDFASHRTASDGTMNRLYAIESTYSLTGAAADQRLAVPASAIPLLLLQLAAELFTKLNLPLPGPAAELAAIFSRPGKSLTGATFVKAVAQDLVASRGGSLITVGPRQPAAAHALAYLLNDALGNAGRTVSYTADPDRARPDHADAIIELARALANGKVDTLLMLGGNPAFDAPADLEFARHLANAPTAIHLSLYENETSAQCAWHLPRAHYLESWSDSRSYDGTVSVVQPLIQPLYAGRSAIELIALLLGDEAQAGYDIVQETFNSEIARGSAPSSWRATLHDGFVKGSQFRREVPPGQWQRIAPALGQLATSQLPAEDNLEVLFAPDQRVYDGRFANNAWLQELPAPITKLTWDNAALISPGTAERLGVNTGDLVKLRYRGRELEIAAYVMPGQPDNSIQLPLGYGRTAAGSAGTGVGFNTYRLRTTDSLTYGLGLQVSTTGRGHRLACTQQHHQIDAVGQSARQKRIDLLVREGDLSKFKRDPEFARHRGEEPELVSLWKAHEFEGHRWGMTIDLTRCIGCNACVVACQAENNIPVVGKENVLVGREMHWIRIDRYFSGTPAAPAISFQPVACHQCENAPCEEVCPVAATQHSKEGLNEMIYNRCIGTRYCSNNCPYKVRRFNYFNHHKDVAEVEKMLYNPEVTLRSRGVMEKCTYCVQRINRAKIEAGNERREIRDGEITPACAQTCPTEAIVFGDLADPESRVARLQQSPRSYAMLAELNVKPRTHYLARLKNKHPGSKEKA